MKKALFGSLALVAIGLGPAAAADLKAPVYKAPPPVVDAFNWTGFYLGVNVGYSWGRSHTDATFFRTDTGAVLATGSNSFNMDGIIGGGQVGYNWQVNKWLWGIEADFQGSGQKGSTTFLCGANATVCSPGNTFTTAAFAPDSLTLNQRLEWFGTLRGRLGLIATPTVLLYATGGLAYGGIKTDGTITGFSQVAAVAGTFSHSATRAGWTVGAGIEGRLRGNWTGKIEYLYMDLGSVSGTATLPTAAPPLGITYNSRITDNILRVGVNYHFGGPVVAKY